LGAYVIKEGDGTIVADTTSILSRWEQFYSNLLNVNQNTNLEKPDIPEPSLIEVERAIENFKKRKAPGADHIPSKLIEKGRDKLYEEIHKLIVFIWNKEELPQEWKESIIVPIHKECDRMDCNNYIRISLLSTS
jgi:hypothetical protein